MKYYLVRYLDKTATEPYEAERIECETVFEAIDLLRDTIGDEELYPALQHSFSKQIHWIDKFIGPVGYAILDDSQGDKING